MNKKQTKKSIHKLEKRLKKKLLSEWRLKVLERDNYTDQITGENLKNNPRNCHVHHILDKKNFPDLKLDVVNGITLSYRSHKVGPLSPHMNAIFFADFFKNKFPDRHEYLMKYLMKYLETKNVITKE